MLRISYGFPHDLGDSNSRWHWMEFDCLDEEEELSNMGYYFAGNVVLGPPEGEDGDGSIFNERNLLEWENCPFGAES